MGTGANLEVLRSQGQSLMVGTEASHCRIMSVSLSSTYQPYSYLGQELPACRIAREHFCCPCYPASGILLWQSEPTKIYSTCPASDPVPKLTSLSTTAAFLNWAQIFPHPQRMFTSPEQKWELLFSFPKDISPEATLDSHLIYWCW